MGDCFLFLSAQDGQIVAMVSGCFAGIPAHGRGNPWRSSVGTQWETCGKTQRYTLKTKTSPQKKVLSLVLCVAMLLSVMVMGTGAASFTDQDEFSDNYAEAAEVLTGMGIIQGYDDGSFLPQRNINRAQVATMIYRAATGDVTDSKISQFVGEDLFDDVNADDWFAGYVNYCGNAEYIKGFTPDTFGPYKQVTGYQVLAMILRAVGYDENDEYTGDQWTLRVAATAREQGLLDNLNPDTNLAEPATRELVAQLIFEAIQIDTVRYSLAAGEYRPSTTPASSLGEQVFDLDVNNSADEWGRPEVLWTYNTGDEETVIEIDPVATYTTAVAECDVADDVGLTKDTVFDTYTNGQTGKETIEVKAIKDNNIGAQGQLVEVYVYTDVDGNDKKCIVAIDTFLAQVTGVTEVKYDANNHVAKDASLTLTVYDGKDTKVTLTSDTNYTYAVGDMLLVNAYADSNGKVIDTGKAEHVGDAEQYVEIVSAAESFVGAQTKIHSNADYHTVNGTDYPDAVKFFRNDAGTNRTENFNWWMDQYDNLIGVTGITSNYAVLKDMIWIQGTPGYAQATLVYMDGTEATVTVNSIDGTQGNGDFSSWNANNTVPYMNDSATTGAFTGKYAHVSTDSSLNGLYEGYAMYRVDTNSDGSVNLQGTEQYNDRTLNIGYEDDATLDVDASAIMSNDGSVETHVSSLTKFLVNDNGTYTAYTGTANLGEYNNRTVEVFYDDEDLDGIADYVYIKTFSSVFGDYVFATDDASYTTPDKNGVVTLEGVYVDGKLTEITALEAVAEELTNNMGKLYSATWVDDKDTTSADYGYLTDIELVSENTDSDTQALGTEANYLENTSSANLVLTGNTLLIKDQDLSYNVTNADEVIYTDAAYEMTLADAIKAGNYGIWVVGNQFNNTATVYVGEKLETENGIDVNGETGLKVDDPTGSDTNYTVTINDKNADGTLDVKVNILAKSEYAGFYITKQGEATGKLYDFDDVATLENVKKGDVYTVYAYTECGYNPSGDVNVDNCLDNNKMWTITIDGWKIISDAVPYIYNGDGDAELYKDVDVYYNFTDAVTEEHIIDIDNDNHYLYAKFMLDVANLTNSELKVVRFTDQNPTEEGFNAANGTAVPVTAGVSDKYQIDDLASGTIVVVELTSRNPAITGSDSDPVYFAFRVNNNNI